MDNVKEWTSLTMPEQLTMASDRKRLDKSLCRIVRLVHLNYLQLSHEVVRRRTKLPFRPESNCVSDLFLVMSVTFYHSFVSDVLKDVSGQAPV